ncbi:hypothetical protein BOX15_Mlig002191g1 [Macrostomum lignano]|uniref:Uncharacterized protein n=1 Tax=Macrostomum lignano TaxID=282301 RepID=A0A267FXQ6_9PLAT|nr:hypothetical protein BOX15_Mlig002191g1 [Macrostomum lignano]
MTTSLRMRRAVSADRLNSRKSESLSDELDGGGTNFACSLAGFPYCCAKHYYEYRRWPYYLEPPPAAAYPTYRTSRYYLDWSRYPNGYPFSSYYYNYYYADYRRYRPWYSGYYSYNDYYGDYLRGYAEGMRKYGDGELATKRLLRSRRASAAATAAVDELLAEGARTSCYYRPYTSRYL